MLHFIQCDFISSFSHSLSGGEKWGDLPQRKWLCSTVSPLCWRKKEHHTIQNFYIILDQKVIPLYNTDQNYCLRRALQITFCFCCVLWRGVIQLLYIHPDDHVWHCCWQCEGECSDKRIQRKNSSQCCVNRTSLAYVHLLYLQGTPHSVHCYLDISSFSMVCTQQGLHIWTMESLDVHLFFAHTLVTSST